MATEGQHAVDCRRHCKLTWSHFVLLGRVAGDGRRLRCWIAHPPGPGMPHSQMYAAHRLRPQGRSVAVHRVAQGRTGCDRPGAHPLVRALERDGIVVRRYFPEVPPCVEYGLTDLGVTLCEPVGAIRAWAEKYGEAILTARQRYERNQPAGPGDATPR